MNIEEYLSNFYKGKKNPTLDAMQYLMEEFNHPEKDLKIIHIAGTNGKGSCVEMLNNVLISAGYKVGKFITPHLIKYNELISVQNQNITDDEMENLISIIKPKMEKYNENSQMKITLFELIATMAILHFAKNKCDVVVLETFRGGIYDCTNIVDPLVSIIVSIGYDHMNTLGNTLVEIAENKAGIIKKDSKTIFVEIENQDVNNLIIEKCKKENNELHLIKKEDICNYTYNSEFQKFNYKDLKDVEINLRGEKQIYNASIVIECSKILNNMNFNISEKSIKDGLKNVIHRARFETISQNPTIIYDGGHNEPAIKNFIHSLDMYYKKEKKVLIVQLLKTKDYKMVLKLLVNNENDVFIFTDGNNEKKYWDKNVLLDFARNIMPNSNNLYAQSLENAICNSRKEYKDRTIFIVGSFYIYKDVVNILELGK